MSTPGAERPTSVRYYVLAALLVITGINYIQRNCISPSATSIETSLGVTAVQLDLAAGAFFLAYTLLQVPTGWLAQRFGSRMMLPLFAAGWSLALVICGLASGFPDLYAGRLLMGALQAGIFPCATLVLASWYPASQRGLATALLNSFMMMGGAAGVMLAGYLLEPLGWRGVFLAYAAPGFLWAVWFAWWFRNHPEDHPRVNAAERALLAEGRPTLTAPRSESAARPALASWTLIFSMSVVLLCSQQFFRAAANRLFDSRMPTYLEEERGQSKKDAAILASFPQWAGVFGGIAGGALSDWILRRTGKRRLARNGVAIGSLLLSTLIYLLAYQMDSIRPAIALLSAGLFIFCFSSPCAYALAIDIGGKHLAIVFGLMNMIGNLGAFALVSGISGLVQFGGWPFALGVWLSLHLVAVVCWIFLNPNVVIGEARHSE